MRIGEVLLKQGILKPAQLQRALAEQRAEGISLEEALIGLGFVTEEMLAQSLALASGLPFFDGAIARSQPAAAALVPEEFARRHRLCPISFEGDVLEVVQANPFDLLAIEQLRQASGRDVQARCAGRTCVDQMIATTYGPPPAEAGPPISESPVPASVDVEPAMAKPAEPEHRARGLDDLGLGRRSATHLKELVSRSQGIIVVTGSCGAGKDTTVQAALSFVQGRAKNVVTIERPAEPDGPAGAFAAAARGLLPQDPDVIVIGDLSSPETADLAVRAALSGVLVFATLDSQDSTEVAARLVEMGIDAPRVASALAGVVSQRLVRVVCSECRQLATYAEGILAKAGLEAADGIRFYRGRGCDRCNGTGFRGRTGVFEVLRVDPDVQELIRNRAGADAIREAALRRGMRTQFDDVLAKALFGTTTFEEVLKTAGTQRGTPRCRV